MIGITKMLFDTDFSGDKLRYNGHGSHQRNGQLPGPVVVWNSTRTCNLNCVHCYADAENRAYAGELTTAEAEAMIDDLALLKAPVLLISGGEPLMREDLLHLIRYAGSRGIRCTLSTNGTLIDPAMALKIRETGVTYVGISLDGIGPEHDSYRGQPGSFDAALAGIRNCLAVGQKVGLRYTLSRPNLDQLPAIFDLIETERIPRACFYHLVYSGRGERMADGALSRQETRQALDLIIDKAKALGPGTEILTVDNHSDGIYLYLKALRETPEKAERIRSLLNLNGGNRSGIAIGCIDPFGGVHPDQFSWNHSLGNIRELPFSQLWTTEAPPLLKALRDRKSLLEGRCGRCAWVDRCNGNFRARAEAASGRYWAEDPGCCLADEEIQATEVGL